MGSLCRELIGRANRWFESIAQGGVPVRRNLFLVHHPEIGTGEVLDSYHGVLQFHEATGGSLQTSVQPRDRLAQEIHGASSEDFFELVKFFRERAQTTDSKDLLYVSNNIFYERPWLQQSLLIPISKAGGYSMYFQVDNDSVRVLVWEPDGDDIMFLANHIEPGLQYWTHMDYTKWEVWTRDGEYLQTWGTKK